VPKSLPPARGYSHWALYPPYDPARGLKQWPEAASIGLLKEVLSKHSEIVRYGRQRFTGSLKQRNSLWREYRNFLRQASINFDGALTVPNRSACLLYYYALLNFAKAELIDTHSPSILGKYVGHGLSFSTYKARTIAGDALTVKNGIFRMLYEKRTGLPLKLNSRLPVTRLLANIPEIGTQLGDAGIARTACARAFQAIAMDTDSSCSWPILLLGANSSTSRSTCTGKLLNQHFREVQRPVDWRDHFGFTRRYYEMLEVYESRQTTPLPEPGVMNVGAADAITWNLKNVLSAAVEESCDAYLTPSLYKISYLPMPASLARYAIMFYASSLVRYRPAMLDAQFVPEQSYLFDAIARECALPILADVVSALEPEDQSFISPGRMRI
jgi:YaaC-like Protein